MAWNDIERHGTLWFLLLTVCPCHRRDCDCIAPFLRLPPTSSPVLRYTAPGEKSKSDLDWIRFPVLEYRVWPDLILTQHGRLCPFPHTLFDQHGKSDFICLPLLQTEADLTKTNDGNMTDECHG